MRGFDLPYEKGGESCESPNINPTLVLHVVYLRLCSSPAAALKKRRDGMLADPEAAIVEPRRVKCRMCDRWIKGSNTQEYSSHHWLKHKNKCSRGQPRDNDRSSETAETRKQRLEADPDVEILEPHRAFCKPCKKVLTCVSRCLAMVHLRWFLVGQIV